MFGRIAMTAALLAASIIPNAMAEKCYAIGVRTTNSAGFGLGGTTYTGGEGLVLYNEAGDQIGNYDPGTFGSGICSDFISVPTDKLDQVFEWGATCEANKWSECHGAYGDQTHIEGEEPQSGTDFYGLGISSSAQCKVVFDCEVK